LLERHSTGCNDLGPNPKVISSGDAGVFNGSEYSVDDLDCCMCWHCSANNNLMSPNIVRTCEECGIDEQLLVLFCLALFFLACFTCVQSCIFLLHCCYPKAGELDEVGVSVKHGPKS